MALCFPVASAETSHDKEAVLLADVLALLEYEPTSVRGDQRRGSCPMHGSTSPRSRSFSANLRLGRYQCFRCGSRGNALELWAAVRQISLHAAAIELCELLRKEVPWIRRW